MDKMIYVNDVYIPFLKEERMTQIYYGGSSSGKSFFLAQRVVMDNLNGVNWLLTRNIGKTIRNSLFNEIKKAISAYGVSHLYSINKSDMVITCKDNGKQILFAGLDDVEKLKSITPANGVLERIWIEEATEVKREAYLQLKKRLRGYSPFKKSITLSFNPILKTHWIYQDFFKNWQDNKTVYKDNELSILKTTYKDNKFLTPDDIYSLENESDEYFRNVYTYGNWGVLGHVIFKNWHVEELSNLIPQFDHIYSGVSLKFKLHGLEIKCGMFQAQMMNAAQFMWKLLASAWIKKGKEIDPLQVTMDFNRNFPLDLANEAQTVQALIAAGLPKEVAYSQLSFVDDVDYVMQMIEKEKYGILPLTEVTLEDDADNIST